MLLGLRQEGVDLARVGDIRVEEGSQITQQAGRRDGLEGHVVVGGLFHHGG